MMQGRTIYLDNNATTIAPKEVVEVIAEELSENPSNPSSFHLFGRNARSRLYAARSTIASFLRVKPQEILFTSGGTESMNLLIQGFCKKRKKGRIISSPLEHSCVLKTLSYLQELGYEIDYLPVGPSGDVSSEDLRERISAETILIVLGAANSETGVKNDIESLAAIAHAKNIPFLVDAVAIFGKEPFTITPGMSGVGFSAHKFHGPKGVGFCYIKAQSKLSPLFYGGEQEGGLRSGTESLPCIMGMSRAVQLLSDLTKFHLHMKELRHYFEAGLEKKGVLFEVNGLNERVCNVSNLYFPGVDGETLLILLDQNGLYASHGSACSSGALKPSTVLTAMGFSQQRAVGSIRFSLSRFSTSEEIDRAIDLISSIIREIK